jgi:hypothetical protein
VKTEPLDDDFWENQSSHASFDIGDHERDEDFFLENLDTKVGMREKKKRKKKMKSQNNVDNENNKQGIGKLKKVIRKELCYHCGKIFTDSSIINHVSRIGFLDAHVIKFKLSTFR